MRTLGTLIAALSLICLPACAPPMVTDFQAHPNNNACPNTPIALVWHFDADGAAITADPTTTDTPAHMVPGTTGFRFLVGTASPETFTITATRGSHTPAVRRAVVTVGPDQLVTPISLTYTCANSTWSAPALSRIDFQDMRTVRSIKNASTTQSILLALDHPAWLNLNPGETYSVPSGLSFALTASPWTARPAGQAPVCVNGQSYPSPIPLEITTTCHVP
jgi:hypothetical protein